MATRIQSRAKASQLSPKNGKNEKLSQLREFGVVEASFAPTSNRWLELHALLWAKNAPNITCTSPTTMSKVTHGWFWTDKVAKYEIGAINFKRRCAPYLGAL